jgi:hypothetical protein
MALTSRLAVFAVLYAFFDLAPSFLTYDLGRRLTSGDVLNFFMPLAVLPPLWLVVVSLWADAPRDRRRMAATLLFIGTVFIADGHGMNLAANAVARHLTGQEGTPLYRLDYFFDEQMGHLLAHGGLLLATYGLLLVADGAGARRADWRSLAAAPLFGFAYFCDGVEGQTVFMLLPGAVIGAAWAAAGARQAGAGVLLQTVRGFLLVAFATALVLFAIWGVWHRGFPEFSELGWI